MHNFKRDCIQTFRISDFKSARKPDTVNWLLILPDTEKCKCSHQRNYTFLLCHQEKIVLKVSVFLVGHMFFNPTLWHEVKHGFLHSQL